MSIDRADTDDGIRADARRLLAHAAAAERRARSRLRLTADDLFLPPDARLDDRLRTMLAAALAASVAVVENDLRVRAARALDDPAMAAAVAQGAPVLDRLADTGLLRDLELLEELNGRVQLDLLADRLPATAPDVAGEASLIAQLAASGDPAIAAGARLLMATEARRRSFIDHHRMAGTELPAELHHRLVWWVAAAIREQVGSDSADRAIAKAAMAALAGHDESDSVEGAATRLAAVVDARPNELSPLLERALAEGRLALFVALLARALDADYRAIRSLVVEPSGERLWLALRAAGLDRRAIARIGVLHRQAAPVPEVEVLAGQVDAVAAITPDEAGVALAALRLPADFRAAVVALEAGA